MNWKEEFNKQFIGPGGGYWLGGRYMNAKVLDFISKEIIEKIVQDSKTMTHEELTTKWLGKERE